MALGRFPTLTGHMYSDVLYSFTIGFVGAILFLLVDKYEAEGPLARLLKFSDPVRRWRGDPAQVAALRSRAVLAEILLMNCRKRGVRSLRLGHRYAVGLGELGSLTEPNTQNNPGTSVNLGLSLDVGM